MHTIYCSLQLNFPHVSGIQVSAHLSPLFPRFIFCQAFLTMPISGINSCYPCRYTWAAVAFDDRHVRVAATVQHCRSNNRYRYDLWLYQPPGIRPRRILIPLSQGQIALLHQMVPPEYCKEDYYWCTSHKLGYRVLSYWLLLTSVEIIPSFTPTKPYSRDSETRHERGMLLVNMYAANPAHPAQYRNAWDQTWPEKCKLCKQWSTSSI